jgi:hypothetical protein
MFVLENLNAARVIAKRGVKLLLDFSKTQSLSSESSSEGTQRRARRGSLRPKKAKLSESAQNSESLLSSEISTNC